MSNTMSMIEDCMRHQIVPQASPAVLFEVDVWGNTVVDSVVIPPPEFKDPSDIGLEGVDRSSVAGVDDAIANLRWIQPDQGDG